MFCQFYRSVGLTCKSVSHQMRPGSWSSWTQWSTEKSNCRLHPVTTQIPIPLLNFPFQNNTKQCFGYKLCFVMPKAKDMEGIDWQDYVPFYALTLWMWRTLNCPNQSSGGDQGESGWWERCIERNLIRRNTSTMNCTNDRRVVECIIGEEAMREKSR